MEDIEAVIQVFSEFSRLDLGLGVFVGRGDDPDIHADPGIVPDAADFPLSCRDAQQPALELRGHRSDFIQEQGAPIRLVEQAVLVRNCAREGAGDVRTTPIPKVLRKGGAIQWDEWAGAATGIVMQRPATSSLPVPLSREPARWSGCPPTFSTRRKTSCIRELAPIIWLKRYCRRSSLRSSVFSATAALKFSARRTHSLRSSRLKGFRRKSMAPTSWRPRRFPPCRSR